VDLRPEKPASATGRLIRPALLPAQRSALKGAAVSSGLLLSENVVRLASTALISFWTARALGPADFGTLMFASALTAILFSLSTLGLEVPSVLRLARDKPPRDLLGTVLRLRLCAAVLACVAAVTAAMLVRPEHMQSQALTLIVALSLIGYAPTVFDYAFKAQVRAGPPALARALTTLLSSGTKAAVLWHGGGLVEMAWTVVFEACLASLLLGLAWRRCGAPPGQGSRVASMGFDRALAARLLQQGLPLLAAGLATALHLKADVVMLGRWAEASAAGQYALAQKLSEILFVVPVVVVDSLYPLLARRHQVRPGPRGHQPEAFSQQMFDLALLSGALTALAVWMLAPVLIGWSFGKAYEGSVLLWQLLALTVPAVALDAARQRWLVWQQQSHKAWQLAGAGAALSLALNLLLIPQFGVQGAALAAIVSWWTSALLLPWLMPGLRPLAAMQCRALWPFGRLRRGAVA